MNSPYNLAHMTWLLDELTALRHVHRAVLVSSDGLVAAASTGLPRDEADAMCASIAGFQSLSRNTGAHIGCTGAWEATSVQYADGYLIVMAAGHESYLGLAAAAEADVETITYSMEKMVERLGHQLELEARTAAGTQA